MDLQELLNQVREFYLDHFRDVVKEKRRLPGVKIITEPALRQAGGQAARQARGARAASAIRRAAASFPAERW